MSEIIKKVLKPFGLYKVKAGYLKKENEQLKSIAATLNSASRAVDSSAQVLAALKDGKEEKAVATVFKFAQVDENSVRLKEAQIRIKGGSKLAAAVEAVRSPELVGEVLTAAKLELSGRYEEVQALQMDFSVVNDAINRKVMDMELASEQ